MCRVAPLTELRALYWTLNICTGFNIKFEFLHIFETDGITRVYKTHHINVYWFITGDFLGY